MIAPDDERGIDEADGSSIDVMTPFPYATDDMPCKTNEQLKLWVER